LEGGSHGAVHRYAFHTLEGFASIESVLGYVVRVERWGYLCCNYRKGPEANAIP